MTDDEKLKFIEDAILKVTKKMVKVKATDTLLELSLDSLDTVELLMHYEDTVGFELDPGIKVSTIKDMMAVMK